MACDIEIKESRGVRTLHFGSDWVQGAMRINRPKDLELAYTRDMMGALLLSSNWPHLPETILQIGLGAGSLTRFIHAKMPMAQQTVVESEAAVISAAQLYFDLPAEGERLKVVLQEGSSWMAEANDRFDLILVDGFDADGNTGKLESLSFYQNCRARLKDQGLLVCNFLSRSSCFLETCIALDSAFHGQSRLLPQTPGGNVIALATCQSTVLLHEEDLQDRVNNLIERVGLDLNSLLYRLIEQPDGMPFCV